jgi:hypothetical protein
MVRVVAAVVAGRRVVAPASRELASLMFGPEDHKLVAALLGSAKGNPKARERVITLLRAVAMQRAASPSPCFVGLSAMAEQRLLELRARQAIAECGPTVR